MQETLYNIFYTDDDPDDRDFFKDVISEINDGHNIYMQNNGDELLSILQNPPPKPNVVFLDLNMPQKNGYEVLKEIRSSSQTKNIPVIIFSTSNDEGAINTTKALGASMYITKPSSYLDYKKLLNSVLSLNWKHDQPFHEFVFTVN